jgi:hypothetical protein
VSRNRVLRALFSTALGAVVMAGAAAPVRAQVTTGDTTSQRADSVRIVRPLATSPQVRPDSFKPPVSPGRAFLTSLFIPGLGQSRLGRQLPGAIYAGVEMMSIVMLLKAQNDLRIARRSASTTIVSRYQVDPATGAPILDAQGRFTPLDTAAIRFDTERVEARRTQVEDWIAVLAFNHLFAGADAFVASLLWDLPARVGAQQLRRGIGLGLILRW